MKIFQDGDIEQTLKIWNQDKKKTILNDIKVELYWKKTFCDLDLLFNLAAKFSCTRSLPLRWLLLLDTTGEGFHSSSSSLFWFTSCVFSWSSWVWLASMVWLLWIWRVIQSSMDVKDVVTCHLFRFCTSIDWGSSVQDLSSLWLLHVSICGFLWVFLRCHFDEASLCGFALSGLNFFLFRCLGLLLLSFFGEIV